MQNQNVHSWPWGQGTGQGMPGPQPLLPTNFPPPGLDQNSLLQGYSQLYGSGTAGQPPSDYSQWTAAQFQQWQQWQQWQEKYQQWQAQYGKKYAESLAALGQNPSLVLPGVAPLMGVPKPVEPVASTTGMTNPPLPVSSQPVPPPPPEEEKPPLPFPTPSESGDAAKNGQPTQESPEELSEAEKTFDVQFKQWEGQFNEWKKQNQDHPDKVQYKEYEKKWETWREQLLQRREQMRKKRLSKCGDQSKEGTQSGKSDDPKAKTTPGPGSGPGPSPTSTGSVAKPGDPDYSQKTQPGPGPQSLFPSVDGPKFENKPPFLEKSQDGQPGPSPFNIFNQRPAGPGQEKNFGGFGMDKMDQIRPLGPFGGNNRNQNQGGPFGNQPGFGGHQDKGGNQGPMGQRFGPFDGDGDGNYNGKFRNVGFDGPRFGGNFDNFGPRSRFGNDDRNFGPPPRFPGDNFRGGGDRDMNPQQQRFFDGGRDRDMMSQNFNNGPGPGPGRMGNESNDFRQGPPKHLQNAPGNKPKVPSLFDITVEKPSCLSGPGGMDRKPKIWENKFDNDPFDKRLDDRDRDMDRNDKPWGNVNPWQKNNAPSPWLQPWEIEKMAMQKQQQQQQLQQQQQQESNRGPWERDVKKDNRPWLKDLPGKQEIDRAELSGYVGDILAKLGSYQVIPPSVPKSEGGPEDAGQQNAGNQMESNRRPGWNLGPGPRGQDEDQSVPENSQSGDARNRCDNFGPRDFDERNVDRLREDGSFGPTNFDRLNEGRVPMGPGDRAQFDGERKDFDVDERQGGPDDRMPFRRDDLRNFPGRGRDDRDRFFGRDDRLGGGRGGDRGFGRFVLREDLDDRFGGRPARRNMDRFNRDDRDGRFFDRPQGPFDRFGRGRDQPLNEPVWNPQVFDYSQGRPQNPDNDDGFKISTVVDYSHGENKQTFDYGHGESGKDRLELKSFDYGHKPETPTVIDYGHGVDKTHDIPKDCRRDKTRDGDLDVDERLKGNGSPIRRRSRSPRGRLRSDSRSPHSRFKRGSKSPPFRGPRSRSRDRMGRPMFRRDRNGSEEKLSPGDGDVSRHSFDVTTVLVEDLICLPGRQSRPNKLVFVMRGIPGSGKTYVTKLIKEKEVELGGDPPRILSLDDYFMTEVEKEIVDKETGRKIKTKVLEYEYEAGVEPHYRGSLLKAFKKTVSDGFFSFIIVDSVNEKVKDFEEMWSFAKQKGFQVYIAEMDNDVTICKGRNIHKRTEKEIADLAKAWEETPTHYLRLDVRSLLQSDAITEVEMEVVSDTDLDKSLGDADGDEEKRKSEKAGNEGVGGDSGRKEDEEEDDPGVSAFVKSRWDQFENSEQTLDRLDGLKRRREGFHATMEDYLQLPDDMDQGSGSDSQPGKKRVRWADLEERRQQEKMRAIGFVVGQTDWNRMMDPTFGESALTRTKYI